MSKDINKEMNSKASLMLFFLITIIMTSILTMSFSVFIIQLFFGSITAVYLWTKNIETVKIYLTIFIFAFIFVFLVYKANELTYGLPYYSGGSDDLIFEQRARLVAEANIYNPAKLLGTVLDRYDHTPFFYSYIGFFIKISEVFGGYTTFIPRILNVYILMWICFCLEYLFSRYTNFSSKKIELSILIFGITPNILYLNAHVFRDTLNLFQILVIAVVFDKILNDRKIITKVFNILVMCILIYVTYYTRVNSLAFVGILAVFIFSETIKIKKRYMLVLLFIISISTNLFSKLGFEYFVDTYRDYTLSFAGDGLSSVVFQQPLFPIGIVLRSLYAFIIPFPNFFMLFKDTSRLLYDFIYFLIYLGVVVQILSIPFLVKRLVKFDWLSVVFFGLFLSVISTTFTFRHVMLYYPFFVAIAVDGYTTMSKNHRRIVLTLFGCIVIFLASIYLLIKML